MENRGLGGLFRICYRNVHPRRAQVAAYASRTAFCILGRRHRHLCDDFARHIWFLSIGYYG